MKFDFFSATCQKPCIVWCDPSDLKISWKEVGINLEVNWLCLCDLAHFFSMMKAKQDKMQGLSQAMPLRQSRTAIGIVPLKNG